MRKFLSITAGLFFLWIALRIFQILPRPIETETVRHIVILYTNDVHGHLEPTSNSGGLVGMAYRWRKESLGGEDRFLLLDGGDMWTGPVLSTFQGESTVDVMNAIGYRAAALGNHDLDFGLETLRQRARQAHFPLLAANVRDKNGNPLDFLSPFTIIQVNHVRVGILGLTTSELLSDTQAEAAENLRLISYEEALWEAAAQARSAGADLLVLIGHLCQAEAYRLAPLAAEQGIAVLGGGHCHEIVNDTVNGTLLVQSGAFADGYIRVDVYFDLAAKRVVEMNATYRRNLPGKSDESTRSRIARWRAALPAELDQPIGYLRQPVGRESKEMARLLTLAWQSACSTAEIILATSRYIAQPVPAGPLTPATWLDILPTNNALLETFLTGKQIIQLIESQRPLYGGLLEKDGQYWLEDGTPLQAETRYRVVFPESVYIRYDLRELADLTITKCAQDWRQAIVDWLKSHPTSPEQPLDALLQGP